MHFILLKDFCNLTCLCLLMSAPAILCIVVALYAWSDCDIGLSTSEVRHLCSRHILRMIMEKQRYQSPAMRPMRGGLRERAGHHHPVQMLRQPLLKPESQQQQRSLKQRILIRRSPWRCATAILLVHTTLFGPVSLRVMGGNRTLPG